MLASLQVPSLAMKRDVNVSLNKERPAIAMQASPGTAAYVGDGYMWKYGGEDVCWQRIVVKTVESVMSTCQKVDAVCAGKAYKSGT